MFTEKFFPSNFFFFRDKSFGKIQIEKNLVQIQPIPKFASYSCVTAADTSSRNQSSRLVNNAD